MCIGFGGFNTTLFQNCVYGLRRGCMFEAITERCFIGVDLYLGDANPWYDVDWYRCGSCNRREGGFSPVYKNSVELKLNGRASRSVIGLCQISKGKKANCS